jgi:hypothetical protein
LKRATAFGEQLEIFPFPQSAFRQTDEDAFSGKRRVRFLSVLKIKDLLKRVERVMMIIFAVVC